MQTNSILVIDDHRELNELLVEFLQAKGYRADGLRRVSDMDEIVDILPSLVILDMEMPGMNGGEVLRLVKSHSALRGVPIILITGDVDRVSRAAMDQAHAVLEKPFDLNDLLENIVQLM